MKVGKTAALAVGGGIILLQIAQQKGYVTIDWNKVKEKAEKSTEKVENKYSSETSKWIKAVSKTPIYSPFLMIFTFRSKISPKTTVVSPQASLGAFSSV